MSARDPYTAEILEGLTVGKSYTATITEKRNLSQHNLYWAGLAYAVSNIEIIEQKYPSAKSLHKSLLIHLGYYTEVPYVQMRDEPITRRMLEVGVTAMARMMPLPEDWADVVATIYQAMRREGPHYGVHIVEDSTRFDAMGNEDFAVFYDRAKITVLQWCNRDPWQEWLDEKKAADLQRRGYR